MIYAELCVGAETPSEVDELLGGLKLECRELAREALFLAAKAFLCYRRQGGIQIFPPPDFFIGAHAEALGIAILTRDAARYKTHFPKVKLICP